MPHLEELGLTSLTSIMGSAVRIEQNPNLCYVNTIAWEEIVGPGVDVYIKKASDALCLLIV